MFLTISKFRLSPFNFRSAYVAPLAFLLASEFSAAQAPIEQKTPALETMVVTATREQRPWLTTPGAVTRLSADRQLPGLRIDSAELLQGLPGLQVDSRSNFAQDTRLVLRGFGARSAFGVRGMDIRLDSIPLAMPDGQGQLGSVLLDEVASVELLRGPLATLYGNGAGGVVLLRTETPQENGASLGASAGSYGSQRQTASGSLRSGPWALRVQGSHLQSDGYRPHSEVERTQGGAQLYYETEGTRATLRIDASHDPETQDPSGLSPEAWREDPQQVSERVLLFNTRKQIDHRQVSFNLEKELGAGLWNTSVWQGQREIDQWLPFEGGDIDSSGAVIDLERDFRGFQTSYRHNTEIVGTPLGLTLGVALERMEDRRRGYVNDMGESGALRRDETGYVDSDDLFGIVEWQPTTAVTVLGGLRHSRSEFSVDDYFIVPADTGAENPDDSGSLDFAETSAALGVSYQLDENWAMFGSVGRGFETPTLTEMAYRNQGTGLNTELQPSENIQLEAGVHFGAASEIQGAVTAFSVDSDDELVVDQSIGGRTTYHNAAATQRYGLELEGDWLLSPSLTARGSATWLDAEYTAGPWDGNRLPGVAESQAYAQLRWQPWQSPIATVSLAGRYRSNVATHDDNETFAPDYVTFDLGVSSEHTWQDTALEVWFLLENLTDEKYVGSVIVNQGSGRSFEPAPERSVAVGFDIAF